MEEEHTGQGDVDVAQAVHGLGDLVLVDEDEVVDDVDGQGGGDGQQGQDGRAAGGLQACSGIRFQALCSCFGSAEGTAKWWRKPISHGLKWQGPTWHQDNEQGEEEDGELEEDDEPDEAELEAVLAGVGLLRTQAGSKSVSQSQL